MDKFVDDYSGRKQKGIDKMNLSYLLDCIRQLTTYTWFLRLAGIILVADGVGSLILPSRIQKHSLVLDLGRLGRAGLGMMLLLA